MHGEPQPRAIPVPTARRRAAPRKLPRRSSRAGASAVQWSLDSSPFDHRPGVSKTQIQRPAGLDCLLCASKVLLIGKPGTGKTGLAIGGLHEACLNRY